MPAATLENSSNDRAPVFVSGGRRRTHAVRFAAATLGLLLAGWLVALAGGLIGFSPLPELALPGTGAARTAPADPASQPGAKRDANVNASPIARLPASGHNQASKAQGSATASDLPQRDRRRRVQRRRLRRRKRRGRRVVDLAEHRGRQRSTAAHHACPRHPAAGELREPTVVRAAGQR